MGRSSLLGTEKAPLEAPGRDDKALGPSDSSDTASDRVGSDELPEADPGEPVDITLERDVAHHSIETTDSESEAEFGADISVDREFDAEDDGAPEAELNPPSRQRKGESEPEEE